MHHKNQLFSINPNSVRLPDWSISKVAATSSHRRSCCSCCCCCCRRYCLRRSAISMRLGIFGTHPQAHFPITTCCCCTCCCICSVVASAAAGIDDDGDGPDDEMLEQYNSLAGARYPASVIPALVSTAMSSVFFVSTIFVVILRLLRPRQGRRNQFVA
jgi:hypothetical protein